MRSMFRACSSLFAVSLISMGAACSDDPGGGGDDAPGDPDAMDKDWSPLISSTWEIEPGEEYQCERLTVTEDTWIRSFSGTTPLGSHHSVLTVEPNPTAADGRFPCDAGTNYTTMIYGLGVGTNAVDMPDGVAMRVPAGAQLLLNLHLFNTQPAGNLSGISDILIKRVPADEIDGIIEAEVVLAGPVTFTVAEGEDDVVGSCTMNGAATLFMVSPHMHQLGVHLKAVAKRAAGDVTLHDGAYSFYEQTIYPIDPVQVANGDRIEVTCSYNNDSGAPVSFGDSSEQEMCFATTYRYPKLAAGQFGFICPF